MAATTKSYVFQLKAQFDGQADLNKLKAGLQAIGQIKAFDTLRDSVAKSETELKKAQEQARDLAVAYATIGDGKTKSAWEKAERQVAQLTATLGQQRGKLAELDGSLRSSGINTAKLAEEQRKLAASLQSRGTLLAARNALEVRSFASIRSEIAGLERAYGRLQASGKLSAQELAVAHDRLRTKTAALRAEMTTSTGRIAGLRSGFSSLRATVLSLSAVFGGVSFTMLGKQIFDTSRQVQSLDVAFKAIFGSSKAAGDELKWLRDVADTLSLDFMSVADAYKGIAAAAKGTILEGAQTRKIFIAVSEAATVLGLSGDQVNGALMAISQMISKGKVSAEELRQQLGERLPGAFQLMAKAVGVSTAELDQMLQSGEVGIDVLSKFADVLHNEYGQAALDAETAQKEINKLSNAWIDFKVALAASGFLTDATNGIRGLTTALKDPQVQQAAIQRVNTVTTFVGYALRFGAAIKGVFEAVAAGALNISGGVFKIIQGIATLTDMLHITTGAAARWEDEATAAFGAAVELVDKSAESFSLAAKSFDAIAAHAKPAGEVIKQTFDQAAEDAKRSTDAQKQITGDALDEMKKQYQDYAKEVKRLQEDIASREQSLQEKLRAMSRTGMTDLQAWRDRKQEAEEYYAAAQKAAQAGDTKRAVEFADKAVAAYEDLNKEVKDGERVQISAQQALQTSLAGVRKAGELAIEVEKKQTEAAHQAMGALTEASGFQDLSKGMDEAEKKWLENWKNMRGAAVKDIEAVEDRLLAIKDKEVTVWINEKVRKAAGGMVGFARGGMLNFTRGGRLRGYGGGDRRHILGEDGEVMIRKEMVRAAGVRAALAFNAGRWDVVMQELASRFRGSVMARVGGLITPEMAAPLRMQAGGFVGAGGPSSTAPSLAVDLRMSDGPPVRVWTDRDGYDAFIREAARRARLASA